MLIKIIKKYKFIKNKSHLILIAKVIDASKTPKDKDSKLYKSVLI